MAPPVASEPSTTSRWVPLFYPTAMPPLYHREFVQFRAQLQADREAGKLAPHLTFGRWMAALRFMGFGNASVVALPHYPARRPILPWNRFPEAHAYLTGHLEAYQYSDRAGRRMYLRHVADDLLAHTHLMDIFEDEGFSAGDVRRVSHVLFPFR